jgi:hypothetical protein
MATPVPAILPYTLLKINDTSVHTQTRDDLCIRLARLAVAHVPSDLSSACLLFAPPLPLRCCRSPTLVFLLWRDRRSTAIESSTFWGPVVCPLGKEDKSPLDAVCRAFSEKTKVRKHRNNSSHRESHSAPWSTSDAHSMLLCVSETGSIRSRSDDVRERARP